MIAHLPVLHHIQEFVCGHAIVKIGYNDRLHLPESAANGIVLTLYDEVIFDRNSQLE